MDEFLKTNEFMIKVFNVSLMNIINFQALKAESIVKKAPGDM